MDGLAASYRRLIRWSRNLSRAKYALLGAVQAFLVVLVISFLWSGEFDLLIASSIGLGMGLGFYAVGPR